MKNKYLVNILIFLKNNLIKVITLLLILITLIYELFYCNGQIFYGEKYNFSLCRIILYIAFIIIFVIFKNKFLDNIASSFENKLKKIIIIIYMFSLILAIPICVLIGIKTTLVVMAVCMISVLMSGIFILLVSEDLIKNTILIGFTFGLIFCITTNFNHALDERRHFMTSFNISFGNFDYEENYITDEAVLKIEQLQKFNVANKLFSIKYEPNITNEIVLDTPSAPADYSFIIYIPSAIGILLARILKASLLDMYILGRVFNLIAYIILSCIILKSLPFKENVFFIVINMPLIILLAASYSIDGMCVVLVLLFIAYCLKLYEQKDNIKMRQIIMLMILGGLMLAAKSMGYVGVGLLIFILPILKIIKDNKKYIPILAIIVIIFCTILVSLILNTQIGSDDRGANTNSGGQVQNILSNPFSLIKVYKNHILNSILDISWYMQLNPAVYFYDIYKIVFLFIIALLVLTSINDDSKIFKIKEKIIFIISFLVVYFVTSLALYIGFTQVGAENIAGYQTRYIIPILPLLLMCCSNNTIKVKIKGNEKILVSIILGIIIMVDIIGLIVVK